MNAVLRSALARIASFLPTAIATFLTSKLIIDHFDILSFDGFTLVASLMALIPLNDLGVGAAITSAIASRGDRSRYVQRVALTAVRTLMVSALVLSLAALVLSATGLWSKVLGPATGATTYFGLAMVIYAASFVPGLSQRVLLGVHRNHVTIVVQTFLAPLTLALVAVLARLGADGKYLILVPPIALTSINIITAFISSRLTDFPWLLVFRRTPWRNRYPGASIRAMSGPVLAVSLSLPLALQSDRIVLSHFASAHAVANYAVAIQIFAPVAALIGAAAQPLWPIYTVARDKGTQGPSLVRVIGLFCAATTLVCGALVLVAAPLGHLIGGDKIQLGVLLPVATALAMIVQAAAFPMAMSMMEPKGLRFVAACAVLALPYNVGLSIVLANAIGAPGPLLASVAVGLFVQTIPGALYIRRTRLKREAAAVSAEVTSRA
jgi:O-antigen/teichoic acid export membrane protein